MDHAAYLPGIRFFAALFSKNSCSVRLKPNKAVREYFSQPVVKSYCNINLKQFLNPIEKLLVPKYFITPGVIEQHRFEEFKHQ